jgi:hypothetical protein
MALQHWSCDRTSCRELVARFVNQANFLKYEEKTDMCEASAQEVHRQKTAASTRIPVRLSATGPHALF